MFCLLSWFTGESLSYMDTVNLWHNNPYSSTIFPFLLSPKWCHYKMTGVREGGVSMAEVVHPHASQIRDPKGSSPVHSKPKTAAEIRLIQKLIVQLSRGRKSPGTEMIQLAGAKLLGLLKRRYPARVFTVVNTNQGLYGNDWECWLSWVSTRIKILRKRSLCPCSGGALAALN